VIELELNVVMMPSEALPGTSSGVVAVLCIRSVAVQRHVAGSLRYRRSSIAGRGNGCIMRNSARFEAPETMIAARRRKSQPGQALVETGLAIALFTVVVLGMIEFGYAFMALNVITQAATAGARAAGALQVGGRGTCGRITDTSSVDGNPNGLVRQQIGPTATVTQVSVRQYPRPDRAVQRSLLLVHRIDHPDRHGDGDGGPAPSFRASWFRLV